VRRPTTRGRRGDRSRSRPRNQRPVRRGPEGPAHGLERARGRTRPPAGRGVDGEYAYFVHSYYADPDDPDAVVATADYGVDFPAVVANEAGNVFGTQFHPEKSGETGLRILRNFVEYCAER